MPTDSDQSDELFNKYVNDLRTKEKSLILFLRRAVADTDLGAAGRLVLFTLADRSNPWSLQTRASVADLAEVTGLDPERVGRGVAALKAGLYVQTGRGRLYKLLTTRLVSSNPPAGVRRIEG